MKLRLSVPAAKHQALAFCLLSGLCSAALVAWSIERSADQASRLAGLRSERRLSARQLEEHRARAPALEQALRRLAEIRPLAADETVSNPLPGDARWREYPVMLDSVVLHEEAALERLAEWQSRSSVQHQIRACSLERDGSGQAIHLTCRLAALAPIR